MSGIQQLLLGGSPAGYQIERSLRFNSADSAYLNRTPASAGNRNTWTWSAWVKRSKISDTNIQTLLSTASNVDLIGFNADDTFRVWTNTNTNNIATTQVFRDVSAWYHIVVAMDTTQATASNRLKIYLNGSQITAVSGTYPTQNYDTSVNNTVQHRIGYTVSGDYNYFSGYLTEINLIDGQALTPSSFGQTNSATGVWEPIAYTGTYGTNGFYLNFSDNSGTTSTTLGKDSSGNGNNWTPNNFSVTAGAGNDSLVDTPTSYGTDTGAGGEVRGNYCTMNPLELGASTTLTNGNLTATTTAVDNRSSRGTIFVSNGKWYFEALLSSIGASSTASIGIIQNTDAVNGTIYPGSTSGGYGYVEGGNKVTNNSGSAYGSSYTTNDLISVALDLDNGRVWFAKNGTWQASGNPSAGTNAAFTGLSGSFAFAVGMLNGTTWDVNFGQRPFAYTAPSGFKALCTQNLPTPTIGATSTTQANDYFDVSLYTGTGSSLNITGLQFQPDFVWIKGRSGATDHGLYDAVRGVQKQLESNTTTAETTETTGLTAFNSDGFTVGALAQLNTSTATYVGWNWNAGGSNATNTSGTITSTVRANTTAGFSIVTYTGNGSAATVGHGLGVAPKMVIVKARGSATYANWQVYHANSNAIPQNYVLQLSSTIAATADSSIWNDTAPTSSVFSVGTSLSQNTIAWVAYCFAAVAGYSAFGSYTGNGSSDGPFVYTGFRPKWIMIKRTDAAGYNWFVYDSVRDTYNVASTYLRPNLSDAETTASSFDMLSNGIKIRNVFDSQNASGGTYIYAAFAEFPQKFSLAR